MCTLLFQDTSKLCHSLTRFQIVLKLPRMTLPLYECSGGLKRAVGFHFEPEAVYKG
jgi:hypothetical protein